MLALGSDVFAGQATAQQAHGAVADLGRTAGGADVAAHAVKGSVRGLFVFTPLSIGDVLHNIESLGAAFSAGIAANAAKDFRIQLTHDIVAGLDFINVKGTFIDGTVFDDKSFEAGAPAELTVSEMVDGFATALQNMHPGDRWEIWIPQQMGYGSAGRSASGSVIIKPYTTLIFELEVTRIVKE